MDVDTRHSRADSTLFAALHGAFTGHPWRDPGAAEADAYSLFVARSAALGWLADPAAPGGGGVWGMNDAGQDPHAGTPSIGRIWFQVALHAALAPGQPLPVQAFLACAGDVVARLGTFQLQGLHLLLPVECLPPTPTSRDALPPLLVDAGWFADNDPHRRTRVRVTVDGGQHPSIHTAAPGMLSWMQAVRQAVITWDSYSLTDAAVVLQPAVPNALWPGPLHYYATFYGMLVEWSLDALGWLAAFLASASAYHGVSSPVMLTISRTAEASGPVA
ncbi:MAG: hypothetical protein GFH25_541324n41 [Chloroflexi bacterium AL-N10]|nr:hypothetical protein [Chloroflexi bacterium AL-N10]